MANSLLENLSAAAALSGSDLFYVKQGGARGLKATGTQFLTLVGTTYVPLAGGTMTGALTIASGTLTASAPALTITQTWTTGAAFTGALMNITDTSSTAGSLFLDLQVAGVSKFSVRKDGLLVRLGGANAVIDSTGRLVVGNSTYDTSVGSLWTTVAAGGAWRSNDRSYPISFGTDVLLLGDAAATLAQRNGTTQQISRIYNTYTDSSNYERLTLTGVAGTSVNITAETLGTGGDNIDIVLTPAGTGSVKFPGSSSVRSDGYFFGNGILCATETALNYYEVGVRFASTGLVSWTSGVVAGTKDTALARNAAGIVEVNNGTAGTWRDLKLRNLLNTEYHEMTEMTAPAAPAANSVRIYAEDNGAGKTRLMALFATGSAVQLGIEP